MSATDQPKTRTSKVRPRLVEPVIARPSITKIRWKRVAVYLVLAVGFFLLGIIPMWVRARQYAGARELVQQELRLKHMETQIAAAAINADRGEYEPSRQTASDFFNSLRSQIDRGQDSDLSAFQRNKMRVLLSQRDEVITLLARSDPAAADRLSDIYVSYQKAMNDVSSHALEEPKSPDEDINEVHLAWQ